MTMSRREFLLGSIAVIIGASVPFRLLAATPRLADELAWFYEFQGRGMSDTEHRPASFMIDRQNGARLLHLSLSTLGGIVYWRPPFGAEIVIKPKDLIITKSSDDIVGFAVLRNPESKAIMLKQDDGEIIYVDMEHAQ